MLLFLATKLITYVYMCSLVMPVQAEPRDSGRGSTAEQREGRGPTAEPADIVYLSTGDTGYWHVN